MTTRDLLFSIDERVVYPGYGIARVARIVERTIGGSTTQCYELALIYKEMTVLVPVASVGAVGVRRLSSSADLEQVISRMRDSGTVAAGYQTSNWNKRSKDYRSRLGSGNLLEILTIYKELRTRAVKKELSFGERTLLQQTEQLLAQEIAIVKGLLPEDALSWLRTFSDGVHKTL